MTRILPAILLCVGAMGCDMVSSLKESLEQSNQVADAIQKQVGVRPLVGFAYDNRAFTKVTVQFQAIPDQSLVEIEKISRSAVRAAFQGEPEQLEIAFSFARQP